MKRVRFGYIVGTAFSGSTLLALLLNRLPGIVSPGEMTGVVSKANGSENYRCSCGELLGSCGYWDKISSHMLKEGFWFDWTHWGMDFDVYASWPASRALLWSLHSNVVDRGRDWCVERFPWAGSLFREIGARNRSLILAIARETQASVVIDASKSPRRVLLLRRYAGLEPYVVYLVRDVPGFVVSACQNMGVSVDYAVRQWINMAHHARRLAWELPPDRWMRIRYEDLCNDTDEVLLQLSHFFGRRCAVGSWRSEDYPHHLLGNRMRLDWDGAIQEDDSWREVLTSYELERILERTSRFRAEFGYTRTIDIAQGAATVC